LFKHIKGFPMLCRVETTRITETADHFMTIFKNQGLIVHQQNRDAPSCETARRRLGACSHRFPVPDPTAGSINVNTVPLARFRPDLDIAAMVLDDAVYRSHSQVPFRWPISFGGERTVRIYGSLGRFVHTGAGVGNLQAGFS
jgi:hypothetical protein